MRIWFLLFALLSILISSSIYADDSCKTLRQQFFENQNAKVWSTVICPQSKLAFHTHDTARILIPEQDGKLKVLYKDGTDQIVTLKKGVPSYLPLSEGVKPHRDINIGLKPIKVIVISLKNSKS